MAEPAGRRILFGTVDWSLFSAFANSVTGSEDVNAGRQRLRLQLFRQAIAMMDEVDLFPGQSKVFWIGDDKSYLAQLINFYLYMCERSGYNFDYRTTAHGSVGWPQREVLVRITRRTAQGSLTKGAQKTKGELSARALSEEWNL